MDLKILLKLSDLNSAISFFSETELLFAKKSITPVYDPWTKETCFPCKNVRCIITENKTGNKQKHMPSRVTNPFQQDRLFLNTDNTDLKRVENRWSCFHAHIKKFPFRVVKKQLDTLLCKTSQQKLHIE